MKKQAVFIIAALVAVSVIFYIWQMNTTDSKDITVFVAIECKSVIDNYDLLDDSLKGTEYIPNDGIILKKTAIKAKENDTVLDVTKKVAAKKGIQIEYSQSVKDSYVQGINYLYEFSCGDLSGWMYSVNGSFANVGCNDYELKDADYVKWQYTCDLGNDLKEVIK